MIGYVPVCTIADSMLFISMARILATFDIRPAKDENGNEIIPELKFNSSVVRYVSSCSPVHFLARFNDDLTRETLDFSARSHLVPTLQEF